VAVTFFRSRASILKRHFPLTLIGSYRVCHTWAGSLLRRIAFLLELLDGQGYVDGIPQDDRISYQIETTGLLSLLARGFSLADGSESI